MSYLKEFLTQIANHDYTAALRLWEEYCESDEIDGEEFKQILLAIKRSDIAESFGRHIERGIALWNKIPDSPVSYEVLKLITDIQTTNTPQLADLVFNYLTEKFSGQKDFNEKMRLIGMRSKERFQGAISHFELLSHMKKGNHVFHTGGWGVGEILDVSMIREQLSVEFDLVPGRKDLSFDTAFKSLIPVPEDHFLAMRFGNPDLLEQQAKDNPALVLRILLRDLGPKTASEIKDELCELVIPTAEWARWWQTARSKAKKDMLIETPDDLSQPFRLRTSEMTHETRLKQALETKPSVAALIPMVYSFLKDFPETLKNDEFKTTLETKLREMLSMQEITSAQELQIYFLLQDVSGEKENTKIADLIKKLSPIEEVIAEMELPSFKKRVLMEIRKLRGDWKEIFLSLLFKMDYNTLRDYILNELLSENATEEVKKKLEELLAFPSRYPESFLWYFQKVLTQPSLLFGDKKGKSQFFESLMILLSQLEHGQSGRDLIKKIHALLTDDRFALVREMMKGSSLETCKEFLLLATKCHSLSDHDLKIFHSLAEVVHPSLAKVRPKQESSSEESHVIWTTQEGYQKLQKRIQQIGTVETVENAKEIEVARGHGDLRENAEFKAALEKRSRLQSELKSLSDQLGKARVLTKEDISPNIVGVGTIVECENKTGQKVTYTLLGPWDADTEKNILSYQSKLAQTMIGQTVGQKFRFQGDEFTITAIRPYL